MQILYSWCYCMQKRNLIMVRMRGNVMRCDQKCEDRNSQNRSFHELRIQKSFSTTPPPPKAHLENTEEKSGLDLVVGIF